MSLEVQLKMLYAERKYRHEEASAWERKLNEARREFLDVKNELQVKSTGPAADTPWKG